MAEIIEIQLPGCKVPAAKFGNGAQPFVILPGLSVQGVTRFSPAIEKQYSGYTDRYTFYVFDRPSPLPATCTVEALALVTALAMEKLGIKECTVFGASQGGMMAQVLASAYPAMVSRLILASTCFEIPDSFQTIWQSWQKLAKDGKKRKLAFSFANALFSPATAKKMAPAMAMVSGSYTEQELESFVTLCETFRGMELSPYLTKICCPVLVLGAWGDTAFPVEYQKKMAKRLHAEAYFYPLPYGHAVYDEAPDFLEHVFAFA